MNGMGTLSEQGWFGWTYIKNLYKQYETKFRGLIIVDYGMQIGGVGGRRVHENKKPLAITQGNLLKHQKVVTPLMKSLEATLYY